MKTLRKYLPILILVLAISIGGFFRLSKIGQSPAGLYLDEAALGYNAYSILKTGKDEFGEPFPALFRSFQTFQTPVYTYLTVPFVFVLGLSPLSVRLPSALFGVLSTLLVYLLVRRLAPVTSPQSPRPSLLAPISALLLALSPWHILYSRTAYETNLALFFLLLGTLLFLDSIKKPWLLVLSTISFAISFVTYRTEMLLIPVLGLSLAVAFRKTFLVSNKSRLLPLFVSGLVGLAVVWPVLQVARTPGFLVRTTTLNIFSFDHQMPWGYHSGSGTFPSWLNSPLLLSSKEFLSLYTSYFSPRYLFFLGDSGPRSSYPDLGTFFAWQFPLYLVGLYFLFKEKELTHLRLFVFTLLFVSPIPAALTRDPYTTIRSLPMVIPLVIIISLGLCKTLEFSWFRFNNLKYPLLLLLVIYSATRMFISIFYFNDYFRAPDWDYGWQQVVDKLSTLDPQLPVLVDSSRGEPYIQLLFALDYDPATYQADNHHLLPGQYYTDLEKIPVQKLGRITVKRFEWGLDTDRKNQYLVADDTAISDQQIKEHFLDKIYEIKYPSGDVAYKIIKTTPAWPP